MPTTDDYDKYEEQKHQSNGTTHQKDFSPVSFILGFILILACITLIMLLIMQPNFFYSFFQLIGQ